MKTSSLTPMLVQYLVGLCCLRHSPEAVEVIVGDMVMDAVAEKKRDVDITVKFAGEDGKVSAFKAHEVKDESKPLDIAVVEQLCAKLRDMPDVTHRAVVSTSGFTDPATKKAKAYGVDLFVMKPWAEPISKSFPDFPENGLAGEFFSYMDNRLLYWINEKIFVETATGPSSFTVLDDEYVYTSKEKKHKIYKDFTDFKRAILMRSTGILFDKEPAVTILRAFPFVSNTKIADFMYTPSWPHTHTLQVTDDKAFLRLEDGFHLIKAVTINGNLQWRQRKMTPEFFVIQNAEDDSVFGGAIIAPYGDEEGRMLAVVFPQKTRELGIHIVNLSEQHKNIIKKLKLKS